MPRTLFASGHIPARTTSPIGESKPMPNATSNVLEMTPSWESILPMLCMCIVTENPKSPTQFENLIAFQELQRMAKLADIGAQIVKLQRDAQEQGRIMHSPEFGDYVR